MKVSAVQFKARRADPAASLEALVTLAQAAAAGSDLLVLPEMAVTGYVFDDEAAARTCAEPADGPTAEALSRVARAARCWIVCGFPEDGGDQLYNSALVLDAEGATRFVYRKTQLFEADETWASPGDSGYARFETDAGAFTLGICMDLNDDAFTAWCAAADVRAIAFPTNWLDEDVPVWRYWAWRLQGVDAALVAANTYGTEADIRFRGRSAIIDRNRVLAAAPTEGDHILRAELPR